MIYSGDVYNRRFNPRNPRPEFRPHSVGNGTSAMLQAADRMDLNLALKTGLDRVYRHKRARAAQAGQPDTILDAIERQRRLALGLVRGFLPCFTGEYRLAIKRDGGGGPSAAPVASWELRRLLEVANSPVQVALGFERPAPGHLEPVRRHHYGSEYRNTTIERLNDVGETYPTSTNSRFPYVVVVNASLQTAISRSPLEYNERLGWVLLHEILSHATARVRGRRETHGRRGGAPTDADRITAWLAGAMATPAHVYVAEVSVAWNWDPDTGVHDPLASS